MAYPNFYNPYPQQMYQPPMQDQLSQLRQGQYQQMQQAPQQGGNPIVWVGNEWEAANYLVAPNSAVALWDSNAPVIYFKQADASGKPTMKIYDLVERTAAPRTASAAPQNTAVEYVTRQEFEALSARMEALTSKEPVKVKRTVKEDTENE